MTTLLSRKSNKEMSLNIVSKWVFKYCGDFPLATGGTLPVSRHMIRYVGSVLSQNIDRNYTGEITLVNDGNVLLLPGDDTKGTLS